MASPLATALLIAAVVLGSIFGVVVLFYLVGALFKGLGWAVASVGRLVSHVFGCLVGAVTDAVRAVAALATAAGLLPLSVANVALGRWRAAGHFARTGTDELREAGWSLYRACLGWPLRLVGLGFALDGIEEKFADAVARAPRPEGKDLDFDGYRVLSTLPQGGSGAQLFLAEPTPEHRARLGAQGVELPDRVVVKAFGLALGSSLPQMMRENRALEAARRMGLVFEHHSDADRFYYVMPYVPGDDLGVVTRRLHEAAPAEGLDRAGVAEVVLHARNLLRILGRFHAAGVWHKDIKPSNIVVSGDRLELIDLGLVTPLASAMTLTTHGTEYYRDPELVRQALRGVKVHEVDGVKFDLYSAGAVVYSMVEDSFPAHGNLSRFTKRCPEALGWVVRRAMADSRQRYASADEMLADLDKIAAAPDPFAVRPADLPSMGGAPVELPPVPDAPLPPLRRPVPPPLPHQRRRLEREEARRRREAERAARHRARAERPGARLSHGLVGLAAVFLGALVAGGLLLTSLLVTPGPTPTEGGYAVATAPAAVRSPFGEPVRPDRDSLGGTRVVSGPERHRVSLPAGERPLVVLLTEQPHELLEDEERLELEGVVRELSEQLGWRVVSEVAPVDFEDVDEEQLLADVRSNALMLPVGDAGGAARLEAYLDSGLGPDAVLWLGFDDRHEPTRHALLVSDAVGSAERARGLRVENRLASLLD